MRNNLNWSLTVYNICVTCDTRLIWVTMSTTDLGTSSRVCHTVKLGSNPEIVRIILFVHLRWIFGRTWVHLSALGLGISSRARLNKVTKQRRLTIVQRRTVNRASGRWWRSRSNFVEKLCSTPLTSFHHASSLPYWMSASFTSQLLRQREGCLLVNTCTSQLLRQRQGCLLVNTYTSQLMAQEQRFATETT